jgi:hypothetical protein
VSHVDDLLERWESRAARLDERVAQTPPFMREHDTLTRRAEEVRLCTSELREALQREADGSQAVADAEHADLRAEADRLRDILQRVLAELHDASQIRETPENGIRQTIRTKILLDIIGDAVECPDCKYWAETEGSEEELTDEELTDEETTAALVYDSEVAQERELERRLRERP